MGYRSGAGRPPLFSARYQRRRFRQGTAYTEYDIRSGGLCRYVYIVMLTSHNQSEDTLEGLSARANDYVTKPFNRAELVLRVNTGRRIIASESNAITIFSLAKLPDSRDQETGSHLERVRSYCHLLATALRLHPNPDEAIDDEFVSLIYDTSPLHDIGKVAIAGWRLVAT